MVYFVIDTYIDSKRGRGEYDEYIRLVKPIVESYGGVYLVQSEKIHTLSEKRKPQRVIIIQFCDMEHLNRCFSSDEYKEIMSKRTESVDARALIVDNGD